MWYKSPKLNYFNSSPRKAMFALNVLSVRLFDLLYPTISIATCVSYA